MRNIRVIARLDVKVPNLIKGIHLEGLRVVGDPQEYAKKYYLDGADELLYMDAVASLYDRNSIIDIIKKTASNVLIPMTVGGGVRSSYDVQQLLDAGADKVALNTAAIKNPQLIKEFSRTFGTQCVVLSVEAKKTSHNTWEAYIDAGRERTGLDVIEWIQKAQELGAGEILITSIDMEGTGRGFDIDLIQKSTSSVEVPVIAGGGLGTLKDFDKAVQKGGADGIAIAQALHYNHLSIQALKTYAKEQGIEVRIE